MHLQNFKVPESLQQGAGGPFLKHLNLQNFKVPESLQKEAGGVLQKNLADQFSASALRIHGGSFLFCIPIQVGPATPYARTVRHWMHAILIVQAVMCGLRFIWLVDILGGFWMLLLCGLGWYAWHQDMNITYICTWGLGCLVNGVFDILGLVIPLILDVLTLQPLMIFMRSLVPCSEFVGAAFAWHLYVDYYRNGGGKSGEAAGFIGALPDPMGHIVDEVDPEEAQSLMQAANAGTKWGAEKLSTFDAASAAQQGKETIAAGIAAGSGVLQQAGHGHWMQGFDGKDVQQSWQTGGSEHSPRMPKAACC